MKLQTKLFTPILAILIISFLIIGVLTVSNTKHIEETVLAKMDKSNISLAQTLAFLINEDPAKLEPANMAQLARLFGVDEVHVTDENGILWWGNVADFYGYDFSSEDQTRPLLEILRNPSLTIAQEPQPRGSDGVMFQYISVSRIDQRGIVQVGVGMKTIDEIRSFGTNMLVTIIIFGVVATILASLLILLVVRKVVTQPLSLLTSFMSKAASTGDITLSPQDVATIGKYSQVKDEIGLTISASAGFVKHVTDVGVKMEVIASGDLSGKVELLSDRDTLGLHIDTMIERLNDMFSEINTSSTQVSSGSKQIADSSQSLAQGSTEQAAAVQQLSSSVSEIARKTKENAEKAAHAAALANTIKGNAEKGSHQMDEMITAVSQINEASKNISKIIKTIDDIAFQTNILALNAAVEAARAGQHGKGFAVVAEEVRNLASKSAEAAKDTGEMIQNSMDKAELGARIAGETATSLNEIVAGINESSKIVSEIARSSEEQSLGIGQINVGIDQVAQVVQQNSATAQESAAASQEMSGQSDMLQNLISQFKLQEDDGLFSASTFKKSGLSRLNKPKNSGFTLSENNRDFGKY